MRTRRALTMIELMVAMFILVLFLSAVFMAVMSVQRQYESEIVRRTALYRMQGCLDMMNRDVRETGSGLARVVSFNDTAFTTNAQTLVLMPSARNTTTGNFTTTNASAVWQSLIIYAPYYNAANRDGEIRRYVMTGAPAQYFTLGSTINVTVNATNIVLDGVNVARDGTKADLEYQVGYMQVCNNKVEYLTLTANPAPPTISASIRCRGDLVKIINMDMNSGFKGRN